MFRRREGTKTYITGVLFLMWCITGVWAYFMCTYHVVCELYAKVVAASAPVRADHLHGQLFELVWSGPQVVEGPPAGCFDHCVCAGVCATCSQVCHGFNSFRGVKWTIQLQKNHTENGSKIDCFVLLFNRCHL